MSRLVARNIGTLVTMNAAREVHHGVDVAIIDNRIAAIGPSLELEADREIEASSCIGLPGFVNVHHHLFQTLTRVIPRVQNAGLFDWLVENYKIWRHYAADGIYLSAQVGLAELLLTGCTTTSDHLYLFPQSTSGELVDAEVRAAADLGIRFHPTRGSMSLGESCGGLPPDVLCQDDDTILADYERVVGLYHDPSPMAMCRIALAPCAPFNVTQNLLRETIRFARQHGLLCHTHLAETLDEERYCLETYGKRPLQFMEDLEWLGPEVWYAHGIHFDDDELKRLAETGTGVGHCPASNLRLGSGICRVPEMLDAGIRVGLGVDGSSSNDASNMLRELQLALLVHRIGPNGVGAMPANRVLELATLGGARILRREDEIGSIEVGKAADLVLFDLDDIGYAGAACHDPAAALLYCGTGQRVRTSIVNGRVVVDDKRLVAVDEREIVRNANDYARSLVNAANERYAIDFLAHPER